LWYPDLLCPNFPFQENPHFSRQLQKTFGNQAVRDASGQVSLEKKLARKKIRKQNERVTAHGSGYCFSEPIIIHKIPSS